MKFPQLPMTKVIKYLFITLGIIGVITLIAYSTGAKNMSREEKIDAEIAKVRTEINMIETDIIQKQILYKEALKKKQDAEKIVQEQQSIMTAQSQLAESLRSTRDEKEQRVDALLDERAGLSLAQ